MIISTRSVQCWITQGYKLNSHQVQAHIQISQHMQHEAECFLHNTPSCSQRCWPSIKSPKCTWSASPNPFVGQILHYAAQFCTVRGPWRSQHKAFYAEIYSSSGKPPGLALIPAPALPTGTSVVQKLQEWGALGSAEIKILKQRRPLAFCWGSRLHTQLNRVHHP